MEDDRSNCETKGSTSPEVDDQTSKNAERDFLKYITEQKLILAKNNLNRSLKLIGTNKRVCVICTRRTIIRAYVTMFCTLASKLSKSVLTVGAKRRKDYLLLERLNSNQQIWMHEFCWTKYTNKYRKSVTYRQNIEENNNCQDLDTVRGLHKVAYAVVCEFVKVEIIQKEQSITLYELNLQYKTILYTLNEQKPTGLDNYKHYDLYAKLMKTFSKVLVIEKCMGFPHEVLHKKGADCASVQTVPTKLSWTYLQIKLALSNSHHLPNT